MEKKSGKKCYLVGARELGIAWGVDTPWYWEWKSHPESRSSFSNSLFINSFIYLNAKLSLDLSFTLHADSNK